jgi:hypothetical protein
MNFSAKNNFFCKKFFYNFLKNFPYFPAFFRTKRNFHVKIGLLPQRGLKIAKYTKIIFKKLPESVPLPKHPGPDDLLEYLEPKPLGASLGVD